MKIAKTGAEVVGKVDPLAVGKVAADMGKGALKVTSGVGKGVGTRVALFARMGIGVPNGNCHLGQKIFKGHFCPKIFKKFFF